MRPAVTIFFIGDSLTEFFDWQRRFPEHEVLNLGLAGETVHGLSERIRRIIGNANAPDVLFIMTGINNLVMDDYEILGPYKKILKSLKTAYPSTTVVLQSILPVIMWGDNRKIEEINRALMDIAGELKILFLDVHSRFVDEAGMPQEEYLQDDGVHVSEKGYEVWSAKVEEFLYHLPKKSSSKRSSSSSE
jgi:lysophospholipase L1-like esterase